MVYIVRYDPANTVCLVDNQVQDAPTIETTDDICFINKELPTELFATDIW